VEESTLLSDDDSDANEDNPVADGVRTSNAALKNILRIEGVIKNSEKRTIDVAIT
jgi:hypothetical protein